MYKRQLEAGRDSRVVLRLPGEDTEDLAGISLGQEPGKLAQLLAKVAAEVSAVGRGEVLGRVGGEGIEQDVRCLLYTSRCV